MKYFNYFETKVKAAYPDTKVVTPNKIEFRNGLSFYYEFNDLGNNVNNANYKKEVHDVLKEIKRLRQEKMDTGFFLLLDKLRKKLTGFFMEIELVEFEKKDTLVFITEKNERYIKEFNKGIINTELFYESMSNFVIEEMKEIITDPNKEVPIYPTTNGVILNETIETRVLPE